MQQRAYAKTRWSLSDSPIPDNRIKRDARKEQKPKKRKQILQETN